jgi:hypothetical protein
MKTAMMIATAVLTATAAFAQSTATVRLDTTDQAVPVYTAAVLTPGVNLWVYRLDQKTESLEVGRVFKVYQNPAITLNLGAYGAYWPNWKGGEWYLVPATTWSVKLPQKFNFSGHFSYYLSPTGGPNVFDSAGVYLTRKVGQVTIGAVGTFWYQQGVAAKRFRTGAYLRLDPIEFRYLPAHSGANECFRVQGNIPLSLF